MPSGAVELRNEISRAVGFDLPGTLVYDYPTIAAITAFLSSKLVPVEAVTPSQPLETALLEVASTGAGVVGIHAFAERVPSHPSRELNIDPLQVCFLVNVGQIPSSCIA